ncbi:hypothetical protein QQP08_024003 [Theobroma cacao]|uniref:Uncharacterized protein n=1 Tax=Theobroma cacao TaxID=3641 RepID=A0A061FGM8_THECC|nr:Uncharacterized protein TCM_035028 [Theobroma cacao]WRX31516.1 hypothetical protein QQP08_024003 [Theobroma cacao]
MEGMDILKGVRGHYCFSSLLCLSSGLRFGSDDFEFWMIDLEDLPHVRFCPREWEGSFGLNLLVTTPYTIWALFDGSAHGVALRLKPTRRTDNLRILKNCKIMVVKVVT